MAPKRDAIESLQSHAASPMGIVTRYSRGKGGETDLADRWVRPVLLTVALLHSLASEMPLTGVQYREKFVEETIHRIVYQCTGDRVEAVVIYHAPGGKDFSIYG